MVQKLLLQAMIGKFGLGDDHQSAGRHVQPVDDERTGCLGIFPVHQRIDRWLGSILSRYGEQSCRFVDHGQLAVFVERFHLLIEHLCRLREWFLLSAEAVFRRSRAFEYRWRQHPVQYRLALAVAGRIELQVVADFLLGAFSPPEHRHLQRLVAVLVGILQQFRFAALAASGWRHHLQGSNPARSYRRLRILLQGFISENLQQILAFPLLVQHSELREKPLLQGIRELLAQLLQSQYILLIIFKFRFQGSLLRERFLQSAQFCLHKLAFPDHLRLFRFRQVSRLSAAVTLRLRLLHLLLIGGDGSLPLLLQFPDQGFGFLHPFILFQSADAQVDV